MNRSIACKNASHSYDCGELMSLPPLAPTTNIVVLSFFSLRWRLKFIESEFRGQLPAEYASGPKATKVIPPHMNDMNREETSRYVSYENA